MFPEHFRQVAFVCKAKLSGDLIQSSEGKAIVHCQYRFADLPKAHTQMETGKTRGKIVITMDAV